MTSNSIALRLTQTLSLVVGLFICLMVLASTSQAAKITVETTKDGMSTYILYVGKTEVYDLRNLRAKIEEANKQSLTSEIEFTGAIALAGPGGDANSAAKLADYIKEEDLRTVAVGPCHSACSLMWLAGRDRTILEDAVVGFHYAYTQDSRGLERQKDLFGWVGVQDYVSASSHYFTMMLFKFGIDKPYEFLEGLVRYGSAATFFEITKDNIDIVGGEVWYNEEEE